MKIELIEGYFIDVDQRNYTLKKKIKFVNKNNENDERENIYGYFPNAISCLEKLSKLLILDANDDRTITMQEYARQAEESFQKICKLYQEKIVKEQAEDERI